MPDLASWGAAAAAVKSTFDTLKSAIGLLDEAKGLLPPGDQGAEAIGMALETAAASAKFAEAEVAKALGYEFCKCEFPPTPMLPVGQHSGRPKTGPVYECPKWSFNAAAAFMYTRIAPKRSYASIKDLRPGATHDALLLLLRDSYNIAALWS